MGAYATVELTEVKASHTWRAFDALTMRLTLRFELLAHRTLSIEGTAAATGFLNHGLSGAIQAVTPDRWVKYLRTVWLSCVPEGGSLAELYFPKLADEVYVVAAGAWLRRNADTVAAQIAGTSIAAITAQVEAANLDGLTAGAVADRILDYYRAVTPGRADNIGYTETHGAVNYGSITAAQHQADARLRKTWLCTPDFRVRPWHASASGSTTGLNTAFSVNGEHLMYPGDRELGASAENIIRCRCTLGYSRYAAA